MDEIQIKFNDVINENKTTTKKTKASTKKNPKVNFTQDDMDKLCEVYDWYLSVKDVNLVQNNSISPDITHKDVIKEKKKVSITVDKKSWEDFISLSSNLGVGKPELITEAIKLLLCKYKDMI